MKFPLLWGLSSAWALLFLSMSVERFQHSWASKGSLFNLFTTGEKLQAFLAGTGALTIGAVPLLCTYGLYRFHKSREHSRLSKERNRIDKRISKLESKAGANPTQEESP